MKLETKEISERIKDVKGIFYDVGTGILKITEELTETQFREILYWSRRRGYVRFANELPPSFYVSHREYFFKKTHLGSALSSFCKTFIIKGGDVFSGASSSPRFWLEWKIIFEVVNEKKASLGRFWHSLPYYDPMFGSFIKKVISKYVFEICEKNSCSFIYEASAMLEKEKECLPKHFYEDIGQILEETKEGLNDKEFSRLGLRIAHLSEEIFYPLEKPSLGLCEVKKNVQKRDNETINAKIKKTLEGTEKEKERSDIQGNHIETFPDKAKEKIEEVDEKLELKLDEQGKFCIRINGKSITIEERFFVDIVYLAVCRLKRKDGWCSYKDELKWAPRHLKDYPSGIRNVLEKGTYKGMGGKGILIETPAKTGRIRLGIFKASEESIIIDKTIRNFDSEHRDTVNKVLTDIEWDLDCKKASAQLSGKEIDDNAVLSTAERLGFDLDKIETTKLKPMIRHTYVIWKAVEELGWKFHDDTWRKKWKKFLGRYEKIISYGELEKETRKELGFDWKF